ncbi:MAG: hypothetical protein D3925_11375 [Candidatus Electrothrix sp. AR5]|nr:hypothetical protein [Candidatus Electrothrix sp. AR5]
MKKTMNRPDNQEGFVLIAALLILLVLTVMGIAVNRGTITEWRIAMNDREQKETFYEADAVTELMAEVLVQNIACMGFTENSDGMVLRGVDDDHNVYLQDHAVGFWRFYAPNGTAVPSYGLDQNNDGVPDGDFDCDTDGDDVGDNVAMDYPCTATGEQMVPAWDIAYPAAFDPPPTPVSAASFNWNEMIEGKPGEPFVNNEPFALIKIGGETKAKKGSALEMSAGYLGLGQGIAGGGTELVYNINVRQRGRNGSESVLCVRYAHVLGDEGNCNY